MTDRPDCPVCGSTEASVIYSGLIRRGRFGEFTEGVVYRCGSCAVDRLSAPGQLGVEDYEASVPGARRRAGGRLELPRPARRRAVWQDSASPRAIAARRHGARHRLCGGCVPRFRWRRRGPHGGGRTGQRLPPVITERGHLVFADTAAAARELSEAVDLAVSFSVIEHVADPVDFLRDPRPHEARRCSAAGALRTGAICCSVAGQQPIAVSSIAWFTAITSMPRPDGSAPARFLQSRDGSGMGTGSVSRTS